MKITVLANAAVYIESDQKGLLIDGFIAGYDGFDHMPEFIEQDILNRTGMFRNLKYIGFTHNHPDHYSACKVDSYCTKYPDLKGTFSKDMVPVAEELCNAHSKLVPGLSWGSMEEITLVKLATKHVFYGSEEVIHDSLCLSIEGKRMLITGDADPVGLKKRLEKEDGLREELTHLGVYPWEYAIVNPYFLYMRPGRTFLEKENVKRLSVYHMPIACEDTLRYHDILKKGLARCGEEYEITVCDHWNCLIPV